MSDELKKKKRRYNLPDVYFGRIGVVASSIPDIDDDDDDDDDDKPATPDVIEALGFDPDSEIE